MKRVEYNEQDVQKEQTQKFKEIENDLSDLLEVFAQTNQLIVEHQEKIDHIQQLTESADISVQEANVELKQARGYKDIYLKILKYTGIAIGAPITFVCFGPKIALGTAGAGLVFLSANKMRQ